MTTTVPAIDTRPHAAAIKAALTVTLGVGRVFEYDDLPGTNGNDGEGDVDAALPPIYALISIERRFLPARRLPGMAFMGGWRLTVRYVGRNTDEARWADLEVTTALDEARLSVAGYVSTPVQFETGSQPEPDDGMVSGSSSWTYVIA